ncbi:MAG: acetyl-CoA decarbonylase/synthase complex subunit gamma [Methanospirillum sp.]|nr:acetyl-CoA decarbonylase/synthase complex subunit gamma [Methanospirillum sp.]
MALKALDIYKLLPKKNCKECGVPTCLTFAMKLASGKADIELCPYLDDEAKAVLGASTRPPIRLVKVGVGERSFRVGDEFVFYRHEKTFYHQPGLVFRVSDTWDEPTITGVVHEVRDYKLTRVGQDLVLNGIAIANDSGDPGTFARAVETVEANANLPEVLIAAEPAALEAALVHCGSFHPLLDGATAENAEAVCALAKKHGAPLVVRAPDFEPLVALVQRCTALGVQDILLDLDAPTPAEFVKRSSAVRQLAIARAVPELGYPVYYDCSRAGELAGAALALGILKFGSVLVTGPLPRPGTVAALTLRQNIYTDPQKPIQMTPGLYRVGNPGPEAPVLLTVNFSLTFFTLQGYLEATRVPCFMLIVDTEGQSVLTAVAAGKLSETVVAEALKTFEVADAVKHRTVIIPGYAAPLSGAIEDATGWKVMVGPRDAADIGGFLETEWKG